MVDMVRNMHRYILIPLPPIFCADPPEVLVTPEPALSGRRLAPSDPMAEIPPPRLPLLSSRSLAL